MPFKFRRRGFCPPARRDCRRDANMERGAKVYITGMTHRDELFDLTLRWLNDDLDAGDGRLVTRIFLYESIISAAVVVNRMIAFLGKLFGGQPHMERVRQKYLLRERIVQYLPHQNLRTRKLANRFRENPEYFFPRLPIDALLVTFGSRLAAIGRIKRLSRVAEKVSFRLVDNLFREIKAEAERIASQRATVAGLPLTALISSEEAMRRDFVKAEAAMAQRFRSKNVKIERESLAINDLIGFKIIGEPDVLKRVPMLLQEESGIAIAEIQEHTGDYNAVNLQVDIELPAPDAIAEQRGVFDWSIAALRGLDPDETRRKFRAYVASGARSVRMEIILTSYDELMESEFGRSIHELRILRLRERQAYNGHITHNAGYLIEYLLALASAPVIDVPELPVKMYGRYLPETIVTAKYAPFGNVIEVDLLNAYCLQPDCLNRFCPASDNPSHLLGSGEPDVQDNG